MILVDGEGLPLGLRLASARKADVDLIEDLLDVQVAERGVSRLIYDRAADSDPLRERLRLRKIELICPHRRGRTRPPTQDGRSLRLFRHRYKVERTIAWLKYQRRLLVRHEYHEHLFLGFAQLACLMTVLRRL